MFIPDAFAPQDDNTSDLGRLQLIEENVRNRGYATVEEFEWVMSKGVFFSHEQVHAANMAEVERALRELEDF